MLTEPRAHARARRDAPGALGVSGVPVVADRQHAVLERRHRAAHLLAALNDDLGAGVVHAAHALDLFADRREPDRAIGIRAAHVANSPDVHVALSTDVAVV